MAKLNFNFNATSGEEKVGKPDFNFNVTPEQLKEIGKEQEEHNASSLDTAPEFDSKYKTVSPFKSPSDFAAEQQTLKDKFANGVVKMLGTTASSVAGTVAVPYGLAKVTLSPDHSFSNLYNNQLSNGIDNLNNQLKESFPTYYTKDEQNAGLSAAIPGMKGSANFWFDKVADGLGFMAGSYISGSAAAKAFQAAGKLAVASQLGKTFNLADKGSDLVSSMNKTAKMLNFTDGATKGLSALAGATYESSVEAKGIYDETKTHLTDLKQKGLINKSDSEIEDAARAAGNVGFAMNLAIVGGSNMIQFGKAFSNYNIEKKALNSITQKGGSFIDSSTKIGKALGYGLIPLEEAGQELSQYATQKGVEDYYSRKWDGRAKDTVDDIIHSTFHGLQKTFGTSEGLENGLIGALLGIVGVPSSIHEQIRKDENTKNVLDSLNKYKLSSNFKPIYDSVVRHTSLQKDIDAALASGDHFAYQNAKDDQFKSYVKSRIDADKFDSVIDDLNDYKNLDKDEFVKTFGLEKNAGNVQSSSEIIDKLIKRAKEVKSVSDSIDTIFPNLPQAIKERVFDAATNLTRVDDREKDLSDELAKITSKTIGFKDITRFPTLLNILNPFVNSKATDIKEAIKEPGVNYTDLRKDPNYRRKLDKEVDSYIKTVNPLEGQKIKQIVNDLHKLADRREDFIKTYNSLMNPDHQEKVVNEDTQKEAATETTAKEERVANETTYKASDFAKANPEGFPKVEDFANGMSKFSKSEKREVLSKYPSILGKTIVNDEDIPTEEVTHNKTIKAGKLINQDYRKYFENHTYLDMKANPFTPDVEEVAKKEAEDVPPADLKPVKLKKQEVKDEPKVFQITVKNNSSEDNSPEKNSINTINTEFKRHIDRSDISKITVDTDENGNPIINTYDRDLFKIDFDLISDPSSLGKGTAATLELLNTEQFGEAIIVKVEEKVIGKARLKHSQIEKIKEEIRKGNNKVTIEGKWGSQALHTNNRSSINDILSFSKHNLPDSKVIIGTIKDNILIYPENTTENQRANVNNKVNGQHFLVLKTPEGNLYPDILYNTPAKDIKIGDKTISNEIKERLNSFLSEVNQIPEADRESRLSEVQSKFKAFQDRYINPITNFNVVDITTGQNRYSLNLYNKDGKFVLSLKKGDSRSKSFLTGDDLVREIDERFFNINSDLLEKNAPFTFDKEYPSYIDFLVSNKILTTSIYPKRPFAYTEVKIDVSNQLQPTLKTEPKEEVKERIDVTKGNEKEPEPEETDERKRKAKEKLKKLRGDSGVSPQVLSRLQLDNPYELWNQEDELSWMGRVLPQIPIEVAKSTSDIFRKFGLKAHGIFTNATIYLAENSEKGTLYHEAFHAVFNLYLPEKQRESIFSQMRKDHPGKSDNELEEMAAEHFRDYVLSSENIVSHSNLLNRFFKEIFAWIKEKLGLLQLHDIFERIHHGKYEDAPIKNSSFVMKPRTIEGFNVIEQRKRLDVMMKMLFDEFQEMQNKDQILDVDFSNISISQLDQAFANIKDIWDIVAEENSDAKRVVDHFNDFKKLAIKEFNNFGLTINPDYDRIIDEDTKNQEDGEQDVKERIYEKASFEESQKSNVSKEVKFYLSTIPKVTGIGENIQYDKDDLGFTKFMDFNEIYNYLADTMTGLETIEEMIDELEDLSVAKPELIKIVNDLKRNPSQTDNSILQSDIFRHKFFTTFSNQYIDFLTIAKNSKTYEMRDDEGRPVRNKRYFTDIFETNKRTLQRQIVNNWISNYKLLKEEGNLKRDSNIYKNFETIVKKNYKSLNNKTSIDGLSEISDILSGIGITMSSKALLLMKQEFFKNNPKGDFAASISKLNSPTIGTLLHAFHKENKEIYQELINSDENTGKNKGERKAVNELARFEKLVHVDRVNASFLNGQNKTVYAINSNNYASKLFDRLRYNSDSIVDNFLSVPYFSESKILNDIKSDDEIKREFKLYVFDTIFDNDSGREGIAYDELDSLQSTAAKLNLFFNKGTKFGYFFIPTPSDRGNISVVKLPKLNSSNEVIFNVDSKLNKESNFYKWLISSVKSEYNRIRETQKFEGPGIKNYKTEGGGNAHFFNQFWDLNDFFRLEDHYKNGWELPDFKVTDELYNHLSSSFYEQFNAEKDKLEQVGLIQRENGKIKGKSKEVNKLLHDTIKLHEDFFIDNFISNYYYSNTELTKLLSGDIAFYKGNPLSEKGRETSIADVNKRFGQSFVPGRDISITTQNYDGGAKENFTVAISQDRELASAFTEEYARAIYSSLEHKEDVNFDNLFKDKGNFNSTEIFLRNIVGKYNNNNQTDAQGFITLNRLKDIMKGQGSFTGAYSEAWNRLNSGGSDIKDFLTVFNPIKGFHYNQEFKQGLAVPTQVKYSTVPLVPAFVNKYPILKKLLSKMQDSKIDEFVFESGIKVGLQNKNSLDDLNSDKPLSHITLSNKNWRIPQIVPYKSKTDENFGSQIRKLIVGNLKGEYTLHGKSYKAEDLKAFYQDLLKENIKEGYEKLVPEFEDVEHVSSIIEKQLETGSRSLPSFYKDAVAYNKETGDTRVSLDFPLIKRKIENILNSIFDKNVVKQRIPGFAAVQVSSFGVANTSEDLKFVRLEDGKVKPAEILVSPQYFLNALSKKGAKVEEYIKSDGTIDLSKLDSELRKVVLYRIPTQGKNSMLPAYIKGFLPSEVGSQIILPFEVTTQAGSDYDIDKVYIEMYNFEEKEGSLRKLSYDSEKSIKDNGLAIRQNTIVDVHYSILTDPKSFSELITPNGTTELSRIKNDIENLFKDSTKKFWHNLWVQEDLRAKNQAGKQLVGVYSIQNTAHTVAQEIDLKLSEFGGAIKFNGTGETSLSKTHNIDGTLISDDLSERQTAAVDNAKEPILGSLNDNLFTSPVISLIIRAGFGNEIPSYFVNQRVVKYLTSEYNKVASTTSQVQALKEAISKTEKEFKIKSTTGYTQVGNFDLQYLKEHITDDQTSNQDHHKAILDAFLYYKELGDNLSRISNALAIDTKGVQATISENIANLSSLEDAKDNPYIVFDLDKYNNHSISYYEKYGIKGANDNIRKYLPLDTSELMTGDGGILKRLEEVKGNRLSPDEIQKVVYDFYTYLHTHPNSNFSKVSNSYKLKLLKGEGSLANRLISYAKGKGDSLNLFIQNLSPDLNGTEGFHFVNFNNTGSRSTDEKTMISDSLLDLWNGTEEEHKLAKDLAVYSFITGGFTRTVDSFIDYIPIQIYENIGIIDFYKNIKGFFNSPTIDGDVFNTNNFIQQYIRNNYRELVFIPKIFGKISSEVIYPYIVQNGVLKEFNGADYVVVPNLGIPKTIKEYNMMDTDLQSILTGVKKQKVASSDQVSREVMTTILDKLSSRFKINYNLVDDPEVDYSGKFENGKVTVNLAYAALDTPFHEFAHPFIAAIKLDRPELYKNLAKQINETKDGQRILDRVKLNYKELSNNDQVEEAIVQAIGEYASNSINPETGKGLIYAIRTLLQRISKYLRELLGVDEVIPSELDTNLSLEDIGVLMSIGQSQIRVNNDLASKFNLINKDGSYKRFNPKDYTITLKKAQDINKVLKTVGVPYQAKISKIFGEKGDKRIYDTITFKSIPQYQKTNKETIFDKIKDTINRQIAIYSNTEVKNQSNIEKLEEMYKTIDELSVVEGINYFINEAYEYTIQAGARLNKVIDGEIKGTDAINTLNNIYEYISGFSILDDIRNELSKEILGKKKEEITKNEALSKLNHAIEQRDIIKAQYLAQGIPLLADKLLSNVTSENIAEKAEKYNLDIAITRDKLISELTEASKDISKFECLFDPIISSSDPALALFAKGVKSQLDEARQKDIEFEHEIGEAYEKYKEGIGIAPDNTKDFNELLYEEVKIPHYGEGGEIINYTKHLAFVQPGNKDKWKKLVDNIEAKKYYDFLTKAYFEAQDKLPEKYRRGHILPSVKKDMVDKIKEHGIIAAAKSAYKDATSLQATDTQYGVQSQSGEEVNYLPIFYTNLVDSNEVSNDITSSIMIFNSMVNRYDALNEIHGEVNLIKNVIASRGVRKTNILGENIVDALSKKIGVENYIKKQGVANSVERLNSFIDMVYYGKKQKKEQVFGKDVSKLGNTINKITAITALSGNLLQGISNVTLGNILTYAEGAGGQWYNRTNWKNGQTKYFSELHHILGDIGKLKDKSKATQFLEKFDVFQGELANSYGKNLSKSKRLLDTNNFYILQKGGEHHIQVSTLFALADAVKLKDKNGKESNLYDAYELKNGKLELKEGFSFSKEEQLNFINRLHGINKRLHGVYNDFDRAIVHQYVLGRLALLFRNWISSGIKRRFGAAQADYELDDIVEGNYRTFWNVIINDLKNKQVPILSSWASLNDLQKQNIRRTLVEINALVAATLIFLALDDDEDKNYGQNFLAYQSRRLQSELLFYLNPKDTFRTVETPSAIFTTIRNTADLVQQVVVDPTEEYKRRSGVHEKGDSKTLAKLVKVLPVVGKVQSSLSPEEAIKFFNK